MTSSTFGPRIPWLTLMECVPAEKLLESSTLSEGTRPDLPGKWADMCGVTGWLDSRPSIASQWDGQAVLDRMRDSMTHRGPDDFGSWLSETGQIALANRRLSIVDLSEQARQPMVSESQEVVLSYNGEIYNHLELRAQLEGLGYRFRSQCDSETALYAFQEWGIDCVRRFKGQFAFAAWDGRSKTLYLARDRVGIQPMYFYSRDGLVVFGSELRAITHHPAVNPAVSFPGLYQYFVMHSPAPPFTILQDVYAVPAGSFVRCRLGEVPRLERYWSLLDEIGRHDFSGTSELDAAEHLRETLMQSVRRRLMSDRPVGLYLSGGLDSTSILGCMSALGRSDVQSFSIGYADGDTGETSDEFEFARIGAQEFQSTHTMLRSDPTRLEEFARTCDQPPENLAEFWLWEMAGAASEHDIPVILHGEGADELFFGYDFHWRVLSERQRVRADAVYELSLPFDSGIPDDLWLSTKEEHGRDAVADLMFWGGGVHPKFEYHRDEYFSWQPPHHPPHNAAGLDLRAYHPMSGETDVVSFVRACYEDARSADGLVDYRHRMQFLEFVHKLPEVLLRRGERSSMKRSVELRLPFLDEDMISLAVNLSLSSLRDSETVKYPLRQAMKGLIPERVRTRPKEFFGVSFLEASRKWPRESEWFRHYLLESKFTSLGFVSKAYLQERYDQIKSDGVGFETFLWKQVFTAVWLENLGHDTTIDGR